MIVVDLSDLSEKNHGIAYEIDKLINEILLQRIVFLVNDSTDMHMLIDILLQAWDNRSPDSPNRFGATQKISLLSMGGQTSRYPDESAYEWKRRLSKRMNETSLVGLLYNAAQPARNPVAIDSKHDIEFIKWTRFPMPGFLRKIVYFVIWVYMIVVAISVFIYLSGFK